MLRAGAPGEVIAWRETAILRATVDGAVWIGHVRLRRERAGDSLKLPATQALPQQLATIPEAWPARRLLRRCRQNLAGHPLRRSRARSVSCTSTSTTAP
jgi:hypothetical protein